jgi:hypothetical protein
MFLFTDRVSFTQPCNYFSVHIGCMLNVKVMYVIAWRNRLNLMKARVFEPTRKDNMCVQTVVRQAVYGSEDHSRLYTNPRFNRRETDLAQG